MSPMRDDKTDTLGQSGIRRDIPTKSFISAGAIQKREIRQIRVIIYFMQCKDKSDKVLNTIIILII